MPVRAGRTATMTGTFRCAVCGAGVRVRKGQTIPPCPQGHRSYASREEEPSDERPLRAERTRGARGGVVRPVKAGERGPAALEGPMPKTPARKKAAARSNTGKPPGSGAQATTSRNERGRKRREDAQKEKKAPPPFRPARKGPKSKPSGGASRAGKRGGQQPQGGGVRGGGTKTVGGRGGSGPRAKPVRKT